MGQASRKRRKREMLWDACPFCYWCGQWLPFEESTLDHIIPRVLGGTDDLKNLEIACAKCNSARGHDITWIPERERTDLSVAQCHKANKVKIKRVRLMRKRVVYVGIGVCHVRGGVPLSKLLATDADC